MLAAVGCTNPETVLVLVKAGAGLDDRTDDGRTALMLAARYTMTFQMVSAFLIAGADASLATPDGQTAYDFASTNRFLMRTPVYDQLRAAAQKK